MTSQEESLRADQLNVPFGVAGLLLERVIAGGRKTKIALTVASALSVVSTPAITTIGKPPPTVLAIASVSGMLSGAMTWTTGGSVLRRRCGKRGSGMAGGLARLANTIADTRHEDLRESWCAHLAESPDAETARDARGMVIAA